MKDKIIITRYDDYETVEYNNYRVLYWDCDIDRKIYEQQKQSFVSSHAPCEIRFYTKRMNKERNMKYKVGDKVRVREDLVVNERYGNGVFFRSGMVYYEGRVVTISEVGDYFYKIKEDSPYNWSWTDEMLEKPDDYKNMTVVDLLNKTDVTAGGLIISIYYPSASFEVTISHNYIDRNQELYKRFINAYGDMIVDEIQIKNDKDNQKPILVIKVDYAD